METKPMESSKMKRTLLGRRKFTALSHPLINTPHLDPTITQNKGNYVGYERTLKKLGKST